MFRLAICWTCLAAAAVAAAEPSGTVLLDENAYCRAYYQFGFDRIDAKALKEHGVEVLTEAGMGRLERQVKSLLAGRKIDWTKEDWRDYAIQRNIVISHSAETDLDRIAASRTPPPPADWFAPDFDDGEWPRFIKPFAAGPNASMYFSQWSTLSPGLEAACFRFRFVVDDPAKAGELTLQAEYIGGIRVILNGKEIARAHLPAGELATDTAAEGYGEDAYMKLFSEAEEKYRKRWQEQNPGKDPPKYFGFANWEMPVGSRIYKARNRELGPLKIPASALRAGSNVVAIDIRPAGLNPIAVGGAGYHGGGGWTNVWLHGTLSRLWLRGPAGAASGLGRPKGVQAWAEDMHRRVYNGEYLTPGEGPGRIRLVGAANGTYGAQVVVGTDADAAGVKVTATELRSDGGGVIPASAIRVWGMAGSSIAGITELGGGRLPTSENFYTGQFTCFPEFAAAERFMPNIADPAARKAAWAKVLYFDHITFKAPETVPGGSCQPYWLSFRLPPDAPAGKYAGTVRVTAGGKPVAEIPIQLELANWRLPDAQDLQTITAIEQSPYGVALQYKVPLWSDEHFKLIDRSLAQLARVGNDWWFVPVILGTEFGNADDSMVRWIRRADGSLAFDFAIMDRYLDRIIAACGRPKVISFVVMHGSPAAVEVNVADEKTGKTERLSLGGDKFDPAVRESSWRAFASALYEHMRARGLDEAMHWGYAWDTEGDPMLKPLLRASAPDVYWTFGAHSRSARGSGGGMQGASLQFYKSIVLIYGLKPGLTSLKGWKQPTPFLLNPRVLSSCHVVEGHSPPFNYRLLIDRAFVAGHNGIGRIGGDYWAGSYYYKAIAASYHQAGFSILKTLWPGPDGAEPSQRFEALIEGMQEGEARVFVEQALERLAAKEGAAAPAGSIPADLARRAQDVLDAHNRQTLYIPVHVAANPNTEGAFGWLERSRRLYGVAAEVAQAVGLDTDTDALGLPAQPGEGQFGQLLVPALGSKEVPIRLRNWTGKPRRWTAAADAPWIRLPKAAGELLGQETLPVVLIAEALKPGDTVSGTVTVTDVATGGRRAVKITAQIGKAVEVTAPSTIFNVALGQTEQRELTIINHTDKPLDWSLTSPVDWLKVSPARGEIKPKSSATAVVTATAPSREAGYRKAALALSAAGGKVSDSVELHAFAIPPYVAPKALPQGQKTPLAEVHKQIVVSHRSVSIFGQEMNREASFAKSLSFWDTDRPAKIGDKSYDLALWVLPYHQTVYKLEGSGIKAFSAEVGVNAVVARAGAAAAGHESIRVCFEIHVDGRIVAHSGLMKSTDGPRLLVVEGLDKAKELKLVTRLGDMLYGDESYRGQFAHSNWADAAVYKGD